MLRFPVVCSPVPFHQSVYSPPVLGFSVCVSVLNPLVASSHVQNQAMQDAALTKNTVLLWPLTRQIIRMLKLEFSFRELFFYLKANKKPQKNSVAEMYYLNLFNEYSLLECSIFRGVWSRIYKKCQSLIY